MQHGDISNQRSFVIGFRCEGTLLNMKEDKFTDKILNTVFGKLKRADVDEKVLSFMQHIYNNTEYTVSLVVDENNYSKDIEDFLADFPCNVICNCSVGQLTSMLMTGELSYLIDNDIMNRSQVNSRYCMSMEEFTVLLRKGLKPRNL